MHVDAEAAMSGVSRFGQRKSGVAYSKQVKTLGVKTLGKKRSCFGGRGNFLQLFDQLK